MSLDTAITQIREQIDKGQFKNEQSISQGIVLRVLSHLGWDAFDTQSVCPEYSLSTKRVDFALCSHPNQPTVFIECKQPGKTENADRQLFEYAFHAGVPLAVLTDGQTWSFYLPAEQGNYDDRRVYKLDLMERSVEDSASSFRKYLDFDRLKSGIALDEARQEYRNRNRQRIAKNAISEAWKELVDSEDEMLFDIINEAVEKKCGYKPQRDDVLGFLSDFRFGIPAQPENKVSVVSRPAPVRQRQSSSSVEASPIGSFYKFKGKTYTARTAKAVVIGMLKLFAEERPDFYAHCHRHPDNLGRSRTFIGRSPSEIYTDRPDLESNNEQLAQGWYLMTNFNNQVKERIIRMACDVMGYSIGNEIEYRL